MSPPPQAAAPSPPGFRPVPAPVPSPDHWVVEKFASAAGWAQGTDPVTARAAAGKDGQDWGTLLTGKIANNLRVHFSKVAASGHQLSQEEIRRLVEKKMLNYLVGGSIDRLAAAPGAPWRLAVTYSLRRSASGKLLLMQKERIEQASRTPAPLDVPGLEALVDGAAYQIAGRVAPAISADVLAARD